MSWQDILEPKDREVLAAERESAPGERTHYETKFLDMLQRLAMRFVEKSDLLQLERQALTDARKSAENWEALYRGEKLLNEIAERDLVAARQAMQAAEETRRVAEKKERCPTCGGDPHPPFWKYYGGRVIQACIGSGGAKP
jgi:DNA repair exonuclease SbcCD ATPase subunit